jgi:hypothetical protein
VAQSPLWQHLGVVQLGLAGHAAGHQHLGDTGPPAAGGPGATGGAYGASVRD